jgi:hypothetical protein
MRSQLIAFLLVLSPLGAGCTDDSIHIRKPTDMAKGGIVYQVNDAGMIIGAADDLAVDKDAFFINDPPPKYCALDGGMFTPPTPPGGTLACPDDKNLEGCPCNTLGATASCWPGLRANRNLGMCMDGMTTCVQAGETTAAWGPCQGAVLPVPGAAGAAGCQCFSEGIWKIDNLVPCFAFSAQGCNMNSMCKSNMCDTGQGICKCTSDAQCNTGFSCQQSQCVKVSGAQSSNPAATAGGQPTCAMGAPAAVWSTDTVTVDCEGRFTLCWTLKAGDVKNRKPTDCQIAKVCVTSDYYKKGVAQAFPPLPSWTATSTAAVACAQQFVATGGYAEMSVQGTSVTCDDVPLYVFTASGFCPLSCGPGSTDPACAMCSSGGSGCFGPNCP